MTEKSKDKDIHEKLDMLVNGMTAMKDELHQVKGDLHVHRQEEKANGNAIVGLRNDITGLRNDMNGLRNDMTGFGQTLSRIDENVRAQGEKLSQLDRR